MKLLTFLLILGLLWTTPVSAQPINAETVQKTWTNSMSTYMPYISPFVIEIGERVANFFGRELEEEKIRIRREIESEKQEIINDVNKYTGNLFSYIWNMILESISFDKLLESINPKELISDQLKDINPKDLLSP